MDIVIALYRGCSGVYLTFQLVNEAIVAKDSEGSSLYIWKFEEEDDGKIWRMKSWGEAV